MTNAAIRLQRAFQLPVQMLDALRDVLLLGIRLYSAWVFFRSGLTKIDDWGVTLALFSDEYQVPLLPPVVAAVMGLPGSCSCHPCWPWGWRGALRR